MIVERMHLRKFDVTAWGRGSNASARGSAEEERRGFVFSAAVIYNKATGS